MTTAAALTVTTVTDVRRPRREGGRSGWTASWPFAAALVVVAGSVLGIGTQILQGVLPGGWGVLANSGVMWVLGAFALGHLLPTTGRAVVGGAIELVIASCTYYLAVDWFEGSRSGPQGAVIWSAAGIVAGTVFGYAGHVAASRIDRRPLSWSLVAGTLAGEGAHLTWFVENPALRWAGITELVLAGALAVWAVSRTRRRMIVPAIIVTAGLATLAAGTVIDRSFASF